LIGVTTPGPRCAVVDFCFMSDTIKSLPQLTWLRKGTPIPKGTATAQLNADAGRVAAGDRVEAEIDIMDWLGGHPVGHGDGAVSWARQLREDVDRAQLPVGGRMKRTRRTTAMMTTVWPSAGLLALADEKPARRPDRPGEALHSKSLLTR
jgi:hypothetical protein